ncbi:post-transcriptional regulator [Lederbergia ruris]|uniref:post-transcriptional regulator n=1 Tax=Lederbergia ruris TaxID=217495 RepID=UPI0039A39631
MNIKQGHPYDSYFQILDPILQSKLEEFAVLGYGTIDKMELWTFLTQKKWKKYKEGIRIYELVSDILSVKVGDYMSFATVEAYKAPDLFSELDSKELEELLHTKNEID